MNIKLKTTPLHQIHVIANAKMTNFDGWDMPLNYGSQIAEHNAVRNSAGIFDVSHMRAADISGVDASKALLTLMANDVEKLAPMQAFYSAMLNEEGGVIDDLIIYRLFADGQTPHYRIVHNAGRFETDSNWLKKKIISHGWNVKYSPSDESVIFALQGPQAIDLALQIDFVKNIKNELKELNNFYCLEDENENFYARTGYTGEDGFEWILPQKYAKEVWQQLANVGFVACGLGARDTLRLEAGMALYGQDLDETHTPIECGIGWSVVRKNEREFIGRKNLSANARFKTLGLILNGAGVLRAHQKIKTADSSEGEVTSGTFSPTMKKSIALARLPLSVNINDSVEVEIRGKWLSALVVRPPFVKKGKVLL